MSEPMTTIDFNNDDNVGTSSWQNSSDGIQKEKQLNETHFSKNFKKQCKKIKKDLSRQQCCIIL
ncbi:putative orfan [Tupanvirus soda lake]|uniref:Orfan n=2 Tax=Tupanvirus TaxID=2094720 RepID=A0AC62ADH2_9VIRU|nr:putative orfan [Tupanvirus soda lake]QKU35794.1 putative orfan [Tupanvirus soda lake]